jgi:hypothetical protein
MIEVGIPDIPDLVRQEMRKTLWRLIPALAALACGGAGSTAGDSASGTANDSAAPAAATIDWTRVDSAFCRTGAMQPGDVRRYGMPRGDLRVTAAGILIRPAFALGSWTAFKAHGTGAVAMGDLVLTETELAPVIARLQEGGVEQTAVHHHIIQESPRTLYMHIHAHGDPVAIAATIRSALELTGTPAPSPPPATPAPVDIDTAGVTAALGHAGRANGGVWQVNVPRQETIRSGGMDVPPSMGLGSVLNFQPTGNGHAAITGDFVLLGTEVNPVIKALGANGIAITSLHSHMLDEDPRLFFMHFWANADAVTLARGLRAALELTNSQALSR